MMGRASSIAWRRLLRDWTKPVWDTIAAMVSRGTVQRVDNGGRLQRLQIRLRRRELRDLVERFGQYGLDSYPPKEAEVIAAAVQGNPEAFVVLGVVDGATRDRTLTKPGETVLYNPVRGQRVFLHDDGSVRIEGVGGGRVYVTPDGEVVLYNGNAETQARLRLEDDKAQLLFGSDSKVELTSTKAELSRGTSRCTITASEVVAAFGLFSSVQLTSSLVEALIGTSKVHLDAALAEVTAGGQYMRITSGAITFSIPPVVG